MAIDKQKVDRTALALMYTTLHDENRVWKGFDWDIEDRLHEKGYISNPKQSSNAVELTDEGKELAEELFEKFFVNGSS
ncbi:MAG: DUF6429 family protein [bacterium]